MKRFSVSSHLRDNYMSPLGITHNQLSKALNVSPSTLTRLLSGKASCSVEMAVRLSKVFTTSPDIWLNLQRTDDLSNVVVDLSEVEVLWEGSEGED
ncbi:DNA-binding domain protein [Vibrio phage 1.161.O._10N.261.48.C5]|nr:DNA-binding domain protein [Vibrio phage 1.161.O._10N.261.48.C5]